jgi:chromosome segregation ATPase
MTDIVERLRDLAACKHDDLSIGAEAADEVESLRQQLASMQEAMEIMGKGNVKTLGQLAECQAECEKTTKRLDKENLELHLAATYSESELRKERKKLESCLANKWKARCEKAEQQLEETQLRAESFEGSFNACEKQLSECQAQNTKLSERVVGVGEIAINSVSRDRLAECQAREKVLRDALGVAWGDEILAHEAYEIAEKALAMPSDSTALETMKRQWQREALLEAAEYAKQQSVDAKGAFGDYARGCENEAASIAIALTNMAKELE